MALLKTAVFLASRFKEFAELRSLIRHYISESRYLNLNAIDLNDGAVSHQPPLAECLSNVRRSEFMILLLGETYGSTAPKRDKSFTHLEYLEAIGEGSNTRVLVFCIGASYENGMPSTPSDPRLGEWQKQVEENHTVKFFPKPMQTDELARQIVEHLKEALFEMRFGAQQVEAPEGLAELTDEDFEAVADETTDDSEVSSLEAREAQTRGVSLIDDAARFKSEADLLRYPATVSALEQREEAQRAIDIRQYGTATRHLKRALELKPLDVMSNYWLAQLYVALGRKEKLAEAIELAERAAHIAEHDGAPFRAASSYLIAARAAQRMDSESDDGISYAEQAVKTAPRYARARIELARQLALRGRHEEALSAVREAYGCHPRSLQDVIKDPAFRPLRKGIDTLIQEIKRRFRAQVDHLLNNERTIAKLSLKHDGDNLPECVGTLPKIIDTGRASVRRQFEIVRELVQDGILAAEESNTQPMIPSDVTVQSFPFKKDGTIWVTRWHKQPGDVISPGDLVFDYWFDGRRSQTKTWEWRGNSVRLFRHLVGAGHFASQDYPSLFEHVPRETPVKPPSRAQKIVEKVQRALDALQTATENREACENELSATRRDGFGVPGSKHLGWAAASLLVGIVLLAQGNVGFGSTLLFAGIILIFLGLGKRKTYQTELTDLESRLAASQAEEKDRALTHEFEEQSLRNFQEECAERQLKAKQALEIFEGSTLRRGGRLIPFGSIFNANEGDIIRMRDDQVAEFESRYRRSINQTGLLPTWLSGERMERANSLYRVQHTSANEIVLSRIGAWS